MDSLRRAVTLSIGPGQHQKYMVSELHQRGVLRRVVYSWPELEIWDVNAQNDFLLKKRLGWYRRLTWLVWALWRRVPRWGRYDHPKVALWSLFDRIVSRHLDGGDVFIGWSQVSLHSLRKARERGIVTILEHPMSHALTWQSLVRSEYERFAPDASWYFYLWSRPMLKRMLKEYESADIIHVCSTFARKSFVEQGVPPERVISTPLMVDTDLFRPIASEKERFIVLYCGRIDLLKGVPYLLKAFAELRLPDAELWLVGPVLPEMSSMLRSYDGCFVYRGMARHEELPELYNRASVVVFPSLNDGFGLVILEAMACRVPVIATENTGGPDVIRDGVDGFIIPIRDVEALKERLLWLYEHRDACREMGVNARKRVEENFTVRHYGERLMANIEAVIRRVRG
jgi:glycosyltransferase involved in cell wall biosynthesis